MSIIVCSDSILKYWFIFSMFLIIFIVGLGGATRLTGSGLSITQWNLVTGAIPPINKEQWQHQYDLYATTPEFKKINNRISISEFKKIFLMEYSHRLLARFIGMFFIVSLVFFSSYYKINHNQLINIFYICLLTIAQGVLGWFMVKSGLINEPRVEPYMLSLHLIMATIIYSLLSYDYFKLYWRSSSITGVFANNNSLNINNIKKISRNNGIKNKLNKISIKNIKYLIIFLGCLMMMQIFYGGIVAGLKAGYACDTFPTMCGSIVPKFEQSLTANLYSIFLNPMIVQFIHRIIAMIILIASFVLLFVTKKYEDIYGSIGCFVIWIAIQFFLGILVIVLHVPITMAIIHQLWGILSLTFLFKSLAIVNRILSSL